MWSWPAHEGSFHSSLPPPLCRLPPFGVLRPVRSCSSSLPFHVISQADYILNVVTSVLTRVDNSQRKLDGYFLKFLIPSFSWGGFPSEEPLTLVFTHCLSPSVSHPECSKSVGEGKAEEGGAIAGRTWCMGPSPWPSTGRSGVEKGVSLARERTPSA